MCTLASEIEKALIEKLQPTHLKVVNFSAEHSGHSGDDGSGESHFRILISSYEFNEKSRVDAHRMVHDALGNIVSKIHALSIQVVKN